jgi:Zn-dependent peptidase ImmA (M78 family)
MKIKILNTTWEIKEVTALRLAEVMSSDKVLYLGVCDYMVNTIYLLKDMNNEQKRATLIHELTHAIQWETSLYQHFNEEQKEQYCDFVKFAFPIIENILNKIDSKTPSIK